jgi:hypothetical protein
MAETFEDVAVVGNDQQHVGLEIKPAQEPGGACIPSSL